MLPIFFIIQSMFTDYRDPRLQGNIGDPNEAPLIRNLAELVYHELMFSFSKNML